MKPGSGDKSIELQFAPLSGSPVGINGLQFRMFSGTSAYRANLFIGMTSEGKVHYDDNSTDSLKLEDTESSFTFGLTPGIEFHMAGTDRLSPYCGVVVDFGMKTSTSKTQTKSKKIDTMTETGKDGWLRIGLNAPCGFDWYFTKHAYLGAELGFGFAMTSKSTIKRSTDAEGAVAPRDEEQGSTLNFGPNVNGQLRLGWIF
ncbi:MAG: hypothetical protein A3H98_01105 [Bacteroidetes bacterium RIFCSPLOWO2_02_FULL_36_8]|nr:MAG: hypothetical protein A3H98_01105 [Bacteroidetes bacterium RIFCSPLOWO2_02_FULL_36_8]OFY68863.1 MAG: hypothetical protein A3G23_03495 [Bacteroidetes bacterium RIFCSPLOWO2_12_FULL_37_12]